MTTAPDRPLDGFRVIELATYAFAPATGAILSEWGADVIKVSHPQLVDPLRGIPVKGLPPRDDGISFLWEQLNWGKKSMTLDVGSVAGRPVLDQLLVEADVLLTNLLPDSRERLRLDPTDAHEVNPLLVYALATGQGPDGPDRAKGAYDHTSFWCRSGIGQAASLTADEFQTLISPAFGDLTSALALAGGITAALLRRERTGYGGVVDASLLATGMWALSPAIVAAGLYGIDTLPNPRHTDASHTLVAGYETADERIVYLAGVRTDRHWDNLCACLGDPELRDDPLFRSAPDRTRNSAKLVERLDRIFSRRTLREWEERFQDLEAPWAVARTAREVHEDPQVEPNQYLVDATAVGRSPVRVVPSPVRFDGRREGSVTAAPEHGAHTEEILLALGRTWDDITRLRDGGVI